MAKIKRVVAATAKAVAATTPSKATAAKTAPGLVPAKKDAAPKPPSKYVADYTDPSGVAHRFHVAEFQDFVFANQATAKLTDDELVALWKKTFPNALDYRVHHVLGARRDFNAGRHSKAYAGRTFSVPAYVIDAKGQRIPSSELPKAAPKTATPAPAAKAQTPTPAPKVLAPKAKGKVIGGHRIAA